jgi:hypothetical protein
MDQAVEMPRRFLDLLPHLIIAVEVENIGNKIERILIVLDFSIQAREIEAVRQVLFVDFAEVLIASR